MWGVLLGAAFALGVLVISARITEIRRSPIEVRVLPYLRDLRPDAGRVPGSVGLTAGPAGTLATVFGPVLGDLARRVEKVLGGSASIGRRLERAGLDLSVHEFRIQQVQWGLIGFSCAAVLGLIRFVQQPTSGLLGLAICVGAFVLGVMVRENRLSAQANDRERKMLLEFPTVAELLALSVAAGEGPVAALTRVVRRSRGELSHELSRVLADIRTGAPVGHAFDDLASRTGLPLVARFAEGIAVAVERGTPLADVLHAQAADVREAGRRALIESAARKEVVMMVPVVFLVLPTTVAFALWPGLIGLTLTA